MQSNHFEPFVGVVLALVEFFLLLSVFCCCFCLFFKTKLVTSFTCIQFINAPKLKERQRAEHVNTCDHFYYVCVLFHLNTLLFNSLFYVCECLNENTKKKFLKKIFTLFLSHSCSYKSFAFFN